MPTAKKAASKAPAKKSDKPGYTFTHGDKRYTLPLAETVAGKIEGRFLRDASMDGEEGQLRLGFAMLEAVDATPGTLDVLYGMPADAMMNHLMAWMNYTGGTGARVGESSRSSD